MLRPDWQPKPLFGDPSTQGMPMGYGAQGRPANQPPGGVGGFVRGVVSTAVEPLSYLVNSAIVNPTKELTAQVTGNKKAYRNATREANRELGLGDKGEDFSGGLKKWAGNSTQALASVLAPNPASFKGAASLGAVNSGAATLTNRDSDLVDVLTSATLGAGLGAGVKGAGKLTNKVSGKIGGGVEKQADKFATRQFALTDNFIAKFIKKHGEDPGRLIQRYGISNLDGVSNQVTKQQKMFDNLVTNIGDVDKSVVEKKLNTIAQGLLREGPSQKKAMGEKLFNETRQLLQDYDDKIPATVVNQLKHQYDELSGWDLKMSDPSLFKVNKRVANVLRETLQEASGNKQLKETGREISKLKRLGEEISDRAPAVASRAASPVGFRNLFGGVLGAGAFGVPGAIAGMATVAALNSQPGRRALAKGTQMTADSLKKGGTGPISGFLGNRSVPGAANYLANGATPRAEAQSLEDALMQSQSSPSQSQTAFTTTPMSSPTTSNPSNPFMEDNPFSNESYQNIQQPSSPYSKESLLADMQRDPRNAREYLAHYQELDEIYNPTSISNLQKMAAIQKLTSPNTGKPLSQGQQERADLLRAIDLTEDAFNQGSISFGPIGARFEGAKTFINKADPETANFKAVVGGLRGAIVKARAGTNLTEGEKKLLAQYTPSYTDTEQQVATKLAGLRALYGNDEPIGGGTLEDELMLQLGDYY